MRRVHYGKMGKVPTTITHKSWYAIKKRNKPKLTEKEYTELREHRQHNPEKSETLTKKRLSGYSTKLHSVVSDQFTALGYMENSFNVIIPRSTRTGRDSTCYYVHLYFTEYQCLLVWFLCFNGIKLIMGYLMPKSSL